MKIKHKLKQSANNSLTRIIRDSSPGAIVGTLVGFILVCVASIIVGGGNVFAVSYEYSIKYNDNVVNNMPMDVNDGKAVGGNLTIANETPTRSGYKFLGWCNTLPSTTNNTDSCSGTTYQPKAGITIASAANFHLYTMWRGVQTIQDFASKGTCSTMSVGDTASVVDIRDNEEYLVGKLADNNCWMLDNLRLNPATAVLNTSNTHMSSSVTPTYVSGRISSDTIAQFNADYKNDTTTSYGLGSGKIGVYYNYCAASAGTICTSSNSSDASYDICPAGWRMPTSGSSGEYQALFISYNSNEVAADSSSLQHNLSTPLSGNFYDGSQQFLDSYGEFWSSTRSYTNRMYGLGVNASNAYTSFNLVRSAGYSMRCVVQ